jgi:rod shape-determining protein MreB
MAVEKLAIDFGNAVTKIYKLGAGMVLVEPTVAAVSSRENKAKVIGDDAKKLIGKTAEGTKIVFPVSEGDIVSEKVASSILSGFMKKIEAGSKFLGTKALVSVPCGVDGALIKKLETVMGSVGITSVDFVEAPILSAIGQNLTLTDFSPYFIIDMGAGNTNIAAVSLEGVIAGVSVNLGGNNVDTALIDYIADNYGLFIGVATAEKIKLKIGSLVEYDSLATVVNGRDVTTGKPRSISLKSSEIYEVIKKYYDTVADISLKVLAKLPPEVSAEIRHSGIFVSGGSASVYGLEDYFTEKFGMQISVSDNPQTAIAFGGGMLLADAKKLKKLKVKIEG